MTDLSSIIAEWRARERLHPWPDDMEDMEEFFVLDADDFDFALVWAAPAMADRIEALGAENARLREALGKIAEYLPSFDYAAVGEYGVRRDIPGSPFDRGRDQEARHLSSIARAALGETSDD